MINIMQRVERHIIVGNQQLWQLCFLSKNLYNYCNYIIRQRFINKEKRIGRYDLMTKLCAEQQADYVALPAQTSQQVIMLLYKNWKSFGKACMAYKNNPEKFNGRPKMPKYKHKTEGQNIVVFTNQQAKLRDGYIHFPKVANIPPLKTKVSNVCQVRIIPQASCHIIEVIYKKEKEKRDLDENLYLGIDLGINNIATLATNSDMRPVLVNGRVVKSINQYYNKKKAKLMSFIEDRGTSKRLKLLELKRMCKIDNQLHHISRFIVNYCLEHKIKNIVIGYNKGWKQDVNIGKANNQKFVSIPFLKLINQIGYKAEEVGIVVQTIEESYTSKCDALALESVEKHEAYLGKRKHRGLFQSSVGKLINADVNGSMNILRKVVGDSFVIANRGVGFTPMKHNFIKIYNKV